MYICSYVHTIERMALMAMVKDTALGRPEAAEAAELFKVLGDCTRVMVLQTLIQAEELCVGDLAEAVDMSPSSSPTISVCSGRPTWCVSGAQDGRSSTPLTTNMWSICSAYAWNTCGIGEKNMPDMPERNTPEDKDQTPGSEEALSELEEISFDLPNFPECKCAEMSLQDVLEDVRSLGYGVQTEEEHLERRRSRKPASPFRDRRLLTTGASFLPVSYTHLRAHETKANLVCRLLLEKKKKNKKK